MKIKKIFSIILSIACMFVLCVPAVAGETRASAQIAAYELNTTPTSDKLEVFFSIIGSGKMDKIGCESIYVYKLVGSRWVAVSDQTKLEDDDGMSATDAFFHTNQIYCDSEHGVAYKVIVTVFAENAKGRDTRSGTFYVTGQ